MMFAGWVAGRPTTTAQTQTGCCESRRASAPCFLYLLLFAATLLSLEFMLAAVTVTRSQAEEVS